jgi:hypothetical protein
MSGTGTSDAEASAPGSSQRAAEVCGRDRALLRAVAAGRCRLRAGCEPLLLVDGVGCADSGAARRLIAAGLLLPPIGVGERARLTDAGRAALGLVQA